MKGAGRREQHPIVVENPEMIARRYFNDLETNVNRPHIRPVAEEDFVDSFGFLVYKGRER